MQTLPSSARVRRRREFLALQGAAARRPTRHFLVLVARDGAPTARLGITVTRKIGNAVHRNRVKRSVREAFRKKRGILPEGISLVVIARDGSPRLAAREVEAELDPVFRQLCEVPSGGVDLRPGLPAPRRSGQLR